jgi:hypothetical protein
VIGDRAFQAAFRRETSRSPAGRSLKDFQLRDRIFEHRCSYMIYSESFRALPDILKARVLDRLKTVLESRDPQDRYAYLPTQEKQRIHEILLATLPEAKVRWTSSSAAKSSGGTPSSTIASPKTPAS